MIVLILFWLICTVLSASMLLGHAQREFTDIAEESYHGDLAFSWFMGLLAGPVALVAAFCMTEFARHGFMNPFVWNKYNSKQS